MKGEIQVYRASKNMYREYYSPYEPQGHEAEGQVRLRARVTTSLKLEDLFLQMTPVSLALRLRHARR